MKKTYHLYFDDTGSRDPDKADLVDGDVRRDRMDCFAFGGVLVKNEEVDGIFAAHNAFCRAHDIDYPLHSWAIRGARSEEHTSELQSLMRNSYAVFCLKKKIKKTTHR